MKNGNQMYPSTCLWSVADKKLIVFFFCVVDSHKHKWLGTIFNYYYQTPFFDVIIIFRALIEGLFMKNIANF